VGLFKRANNERYALLLDLLRRKFVPRRIAEGVQKRFRCFSEFRECLIRGQCVQIGRVQASMGPRCTVLNAGALAARPLSGFDMPVGEMEVEGHASPLSFLGASPKGTTSLGDCSGRLRLGPGLVICTQRALQSIEAPRR
jgi:hypothetical protein